MQYKDYEKLLKKIAWKFSKEYHFDFEDLLAQANLEYIECLKRYNPHKAKFSTYLVNRLNWLLPMYVWDEIGKEAESFEDYFAGEDSVEKKSRNGEIMNNKIYSDDMIRFKQVLDFYDDAMTELDGRSKQVLAYLLDGYYGRIIRYNSVKKYFHGYLGWSIGQVKRAWETVKNWWHNYCYAKVYF